MSLADRLKRADQTRSNRGCVTCEWMVALSDQDRAAILQWIADGLSIKKLWEILISDPENPLPVADTAFRNHVRNHVLHHGD